MYPLWTAQDSTGPVRHCRCSLLLPYLFPELSAFATVAEVVTHLRTSDARYHATVLAEFLATNQPPMFITLYFIVSRLPDSLRYVRDRFLSLDPTSFTLDLLEQHLLAAETSAVAVAAARGTPRPPFFEGLEGDCYRCVPPDPGIEAAAQGASASGTPPGTAPAEALHTFKLDSGASRCFICDSTTLTPLPAPVLVRLADPSGGPVIARSSTVLPCPVVPSGSLSGLHLPSFSTNLVSTAALQDAMVTTTSPGGQHVSIWRSGSRMLFVSPPVAPDSSVAPPPGSPLPAMPSWHALPVSRLRSLPPLPPSPAPPCLPCVEGRQGAAPHSSFPLTISPLQTLHMDVTGEVVDVLIPWIRTVRLQLCKSFGTDLPVLRQHSDRGGEFSSDLLRDFCHGEDILQSFTLPDSPQQNGIAKRRIGLVMELNLSPRVSLPETSPTLRWTGKVGDASVFWVWGSRAFVRDTSANKLSARAIPCVFLGFVPDAPRWQFYHPTSRCILPSQDVTFDESVPFYRLFPYRSAPPPPPPLFLAPGPPPVDPLPPQGPASSGVSQVDPLPGPAPVEVAVGSGVAPVLHLGVLRLGVRSRGGAGSEGAGAGGAEPGGAEPEGVEPGGAESEDAESRGAEPRGAALSGGTAGASPRVSSQQLREWLVWRAHHRSGAPGAGGAGDTGAGGAAVLAGAGVGAACLQTVCVALIAELLDFAAACRLDYATALVAESVSARPPFVGGECALGTDVLEDRQEDFECLAAAVLRFSSMLLAHKGDPDALDIPTPRSYAEAITGTYVNEVPLSRANIVDGMWIFRVKRPPGSPPAFKACYVARGFSQRQGVDCFQTFCPTPKMTTLQVLLHVAAQRDYKLHSLDFSPAFLQGSLHEEIWLRRPPSFTGMTTLAALGFAPSTADPSLFLRTDTSLPPFYVLVYVDDLVFATADTEALTLVKSELQKRHTCTDLGELRSYLGLQITRDRARRTITVTQSHMAELSRPYPELVGCLMYLMTCTRADLTYPGYLCSTSCMGLVLGGRGPVVLTGHANASSVDESATQRSSQGYTFSLGSGSVSWRAMAAQELRWLTYLLTDLGEQPRSPPVLYVNNKAMIALCQEHRLEHRTKHIALRYFLAQELQQHGQLCLAYVATWANTADVFTKALPLGDHQRFATVLDLVPTLPHLLSS
ncbi:unnamed protein product [Closterium sp. NIES-53]